jgi:peptide chain release factor subunit 1
MTQDVLRRLAEWSGRHPVTTLYLDVDGRRFRRRPELVGRAEALLKRADDGSWDREAERSVRRDADRVIGYVSEGFDRSATRGLALFSSAEDGLWEPIQLPQPIRDRAVIGPRPHLLPLEARLERLEAYCTAVVDREKARLFLTEGGRTVEASSLQDDVPGQHDQGGWAQARMQRHIEDHVDRHLKRVADALMGLHKRRPFQRTILAGAEELVAALERELHDYVSRTVVGRETLPITTPVDEVHARVMAWMERIEERQERETLDRLLSEVRSETGRAVAGLDPTLSVLESGRADTLVVLFGFEASGVRCPRDGHLATGGTRCSVCGSELVEAPDLVELAVEAGLRQRSRVETIPQSPELAAAGGIGAILRF